MGVGWRVSRRRGRLDDAAVVAAHGAGLGRSHARHSVDRDGGRSRHVVLLGVVIL